jgi:epoxide hydrolase-like predicted phosphatase
MAEKPKALLFDVGNVLIRLKTEALLQSIEKACAALDRNTMLAEIRNPGSQHHAYERGEISGEAFHSHLQKTYGLSWDYQEWLRHWNDYFLPNRPMEILLAKLQGQARFWALSNTNAEHYVQFKRAFRLFDGFEKVIGSQQHGIRKPDPRLYEIALSQMALPPSAVLFVDDLEANVKTAKDLGMLAFHYQFNDLELKAYCKDLGFEIIPWESRPSNFAC